MKNIAVIFGGKSVEHDISIITGLQVIKNLNIKYNIIPIYISKTGDWWTGEKLMMLSSFTNFNTNSLHKCFLTPHTDYLTIKKRFKNKKISLDGIFLALHGQNGEDGSVQGLLELCNIPYSSSSISGSSITMDKVLCKMILKQNKINTPNFIWVMQNEYKKDSKKILEKIKTEFNNSVVIKPARAGSSIGIKKCHSQEEIKKAIELAFCFDNKIIIEEAIENFREINIACLGFENEIKTSSLEEVKKDEDILSFDEKYLSSEETKRIISPKLDKNTKSKIEEMAKKAFYVCDCFGVVRLDFFITKDKVFINEINSIPGSFANFLFQKTNFSSLLENILLLSKKRYLQKQNLTYVYKSCALEKFSKILGGKLFK